MQITEQYKLSAALQKVIAIRDGLPLKFKRAWIASELYIASYLSDHAREHAEASDDGTMVTDNEECDASSPDVEALMAAGRLDWLLRTTRPSLCGLLSEGDVVALLDCYQGDRFFPNQFDRIASDLCDHSGVELKTYKSSCIAALVKKLLKLSPIQRVTLVDALEQTWHRGMKQEGKSPKEFFATLGITLS
jgi:hypothetical protein